MTNPNYRHYVLIVDRSGSMMAVQAEAQAGIRQFVADQDALPGHATLSLYQFDNMTETVCDFTPLGKAASYELAPRNMTALLDACGTAITEVGERLSNMDEHDRPGKVIVLITTDGQENFSKEYTKEQVKDLVTQQHDIYGWEFSYVGANVDAFAEASELGISSANSLNYSHTKGGTQNAYRVSSAAASRYAAGASATFSYTNEERDEAAEK